MKRLFVSTLMVGALILPAAAFAQTEGEAPAPAEAPAAAPEKAEEPEPEAPAAEEPKAEEPAAEEPAPAPAEPAPADPAPVETATTAATEEPQADAVPAEATPVESTVDAVEAGAKAAAAAAAAVAAPDASAAAAGTAEPGAAPVVAQPAVTAAPEATTEKTDAATADVVTAELSEKEKKKAKADDTLAATMGTNAPTAGGKPWQVAASLSQSLGAGVLVANSAQRDVLYGYSGRINGAYKILPLLDGRLDVTGRITFDQLLTNSFVGGIGDSAARQFNFRDIRVGLNGRGLIQEKNTGIIFGANTSLDLPTGLIAQAEGRIFRWNVGVNAFKAFPHVGPGTITLFWAEIFRKGAGPAQATLRQGAADGTPRCAPNLDIADPENVEDVGGCLSGRSSENFGLIHSLGAGYIVGNFSFNISFALVNLFQYDFSNSDTTNVGDGNIIVGNGVGSTGTTHLAFTSSSISAGYVLNANVNFSAGVSTLQEQFIQSTTEDGGGRKLRFPWFDVDSTASSRSSFFLSANFLY